MPVNNSILLSILCLLMACSDQSAQESNRKKLIDGLDDHQVKRVTGEQIHSAAYQEGQYIIHLVEAGSIELNYWSTPEGEGYLDSLISALGHAELTLIPTETQLSTIGVEQGALLEAYRYSFAQGQAVNDNVQDLSGDHLLYTSPVTRGDSLAGMWSLLLTRKTLIRNF